MATTTDTSVTESPIFYDSISGLKTLIGILAAPYGGDPIPVALVNSTWLQREVQKELGDNFRYPYIGLTVQRMSENQESYNANLRRGGILVRAAKNSNLLLNYKLQPIALNFRVRYVAESQSDILGFAQRWTLRKRDARFAVANAALKIWIKVTLGTDLSIPESDNTEGGITGTLDTDCTMHTYIGEVERHTLLRKTQLNTNLWSNTGKTVVATEPPLIRQIKYS